MTEIDCFLGIFLGLILSIVMSYKFQSVLSPFSPRIGMNLLEFIAIISIVHHNFLDC
jgi:hypothetical protein